MAFWSNWGKKKNKEVATDNAVNEENLAASEDLAEVSNEGQEAASKELAEVSKEEQEAVSEAAVEATEVSTEKALEVADEAVKEVAEGVTGAENTKEALDEATDEEESKEEPKEAAEPVSEGGFFARLKAGLTKTRNNIVSSIDLVFNSDEKIDEDFYEELEEVLILGDIGVHTTDKILEDLKKAVKSEHIKRRSECKDYLVKSIKEQMHTGLTAYEFENKQSIVFVIGVNGVGKTTSIGKLASHLKSQGKRVMLAACDTFRAAAGSQLEEWSHRAGVEMIGGIEGQDPASVLFDAVTAAKARNVDVLLVDTAGRLHNKKNLMEELKKMNRIIDKAFENVHRENLIVLDASTGQNAMNQAREFGEVANLTGIVLTKMDGTAKGGIAIAIQSELNIPVKYIGVGEKISDLQKFDSDSFVDALFDVVSE